MRRSALVLASLLSAASARSPHRDSGGDDILVFPACYSDADCGEREVCEDGACVSLCEDGEESPCSVCGCGDLQVCDESSDRCVALGSLHAECFYNWECISGNCGRREGTGKGTCQVAGGAECRAETCIACEPNLDGDVCAQFCHGDDDCLDGERCELERAGSYKVCRRDCRTQACPALWECSLDGACRPPARCNPAMPGSCPLGQVCDLLQEVCVGR